MRTIDSDIVAQLEAEELRPFYLLEMTLGETTYRYTDCDIPLYVPYTVSEGAQFTPLGFKINPIRYSIQDIVDNVTIEVDGLETVLKSIFVGGNPQGSAVNLLTIVLDSSYNIVGLPSKWPVTAGDLQGAVTLFEGTIDSWDLTEERIQITVVNKLSQWNQSTLNKYSVSCRWKVFNSSTLGTSGIECTSTAGGDWCDRTYSRCVELNSISGANSIFGGFRWLPSITDKEIWWGRVPK